MEPQTSLTAPDEFHSDAAGARRLVIRIILPTGALQAPVRQPTPRRALLLSAGAVAVLLVVAGVSIFRGQSKSAAEPPASTQAVNSSLPEPARHAAAPARPEAVSVERSPTEPEGAQSNVRPSAPPTPIDTVTPTVPQSALNTIRGTVRVSVRVTIDESGAVVAANSVESGPSRYFERLSLEASRKWTFNADAAQAQRTMLLRFSFRRSGVAAKAEAAE